jgi:hypothetical protein
VKRKRIFGSPHEVYLAVVETAAQAHDLFAALRQEGLNGETISFFHGETAAKAFENITIRSLGLNSLQASLRRLFAADEVAKEKDYHEALEKGYFVVQVEMAEAESLRPKVEECLANYARNIYYFGRWTFEKVAEP